MPHFVYDVEGWAWHAKAIALARQFRPELASGVAGGGVVGEHECGRIVADSTIGKVPAALVFFAPQQFLRVGGYWDAGFVRDNVFVGASFPSELPALARLAGKVAGIFVNNRRMHDTLAAGGIGAHLIPNGVDCEFWHPFASRLRDGKDEDDEPLRVGWVGNSRHHTHGGRAPHKGFSLIAEAAARAGVVLIAKDTAGDYSGGSYWLAEEVRHRIYHQIDVLAVGSEMEGTPNPALEAMACCVPVVTTPVGDAADLIERNGGGWVVDRCVEAFQFLFANLSRIACFETGTIGREVVYRHRSWAQAADGFRRMFKRAAEGNAP